MVNINKTVYLLRENSAVFSMKRNKFDRYSTSTNLGAVGKPHTFLFPYLLRAGVDRRTTKHMSVDKPRIIIALLRASSIVVPGLYLI